MCRFRNIILQQKIPHVKTFFRPLRFYPFFVRIHHGTVSACIVHTNAQIKTDSFCRHGDPFSIFTELIIMLRKLSDFMLLNTLRYDLTLLF
jgi:hypothetical protein